MRKIRRSRQVADCRGLLHTALVQASRKQRQIRTGDYPPEARIRLGQAVVKARMAAGMQFRTDLVDAIKAAGRKISPRSVQALETADASVGQSVLFAVARQLPGWNEDTPREILEGKPAPEPTNGKQLPVDLESAPHEWSAEARRKIITMSFDEMLEIAMRVRSKRGDRAAVTWLREATRLKSEAPAIEAEIGHFES